jgi:ABC-type transport system involved in cytochrome bd biosynthesis fused ATPase/permease subunit
LALATLESLATIRGALDTALMVSAAAERLEELDVAHSRGETSWPSDSTLELRDLSIVDGSAVVTHANLTLEPGRKVAITGASGAGKSSLLRVLAFLDAPADGSVTVGGVALNDLDEDRLRERVAYVPSEPGLFRGLVLDVVGLGRNSPRSILDDLAALGVHVDATTRWEELSRGEGQRVALVRSMVSDPSVYILDEPTSGLGAAETLSFLTLLSSTGSAVVVATHDTMVMQWCDEVFELVGSQLRSVSR